MENSNLENGTAREEELTKMEVNTLVNMRKINLRERAYGHSKMERNTKGNGKMESTMVEARKF